MKYVYDKLTIKTLELCQWYCSAVFIVNFETISPISLVLYCNFEQVQYMFIEKGHLEHAESCTLH